MADAAILSASSSPFQTSISFNRLLLLLFRYLLSHSLLFQFGHRCFACVDVSAFADARFCCDDTSSQAKTGFEREFLAIDPSPQFRVQLIHLPSTCSNIQTPFWQQKTTTTPSFASTTHQIYKKKPATRTANNNNEMQIKYRSSTKLAMDDSESILNQLILLTEQYKRVNELLENKRNMLKQRALILRKRQLQHKCDLQRMWLTLTQTDHNFVASPARINEIDSNMDAQ